MISSEQNNQELPNDENELDLQVDFVTAHEYIMSVCSALSVVDNYDTMIMSKTDEQRIKRIRRKSLKILDNCICELYDEIFETDDDE
jgi:hypothetical protein